MRWVLPFALVSIACSESRSGDASKKNEEAEPEGKTLLGVWPEKWACDSVAPPAELAQALAGEVKVEESPFTPPRGVPKPCSYSVPQAATTDAGAATVESWSFDVDCRDGYEETATRIFTDWARQSEEYVAEYKKRVGTGKPPTNDAGVPLKAPEASRDANVGRKALDAHGQGLIFLDDDSPCYVRVFGPDAERRLALATLVARHLTEATAPMKPHGDPVFKPGAP